MSQNFIKRLLGKKTNNQSTSVTQASDDKFRVDFEEFSHDAQGRIRVSEMNTLFDGKLINLDNSDVWHGVGTGTFSYTNNISNMSVNSGQYYVRQSSRFMPYYSGKANLNEFTMENFHLQTDVEKGFGVLSSSSSATYSTVYDGVGIFNTGTSYEFRVYNNGTLVSSTDWTSWVGYSQISSYDFSKFNVFAIDFLWLGGAIIRLFIKSQIDDSFILLHTYKHVGIAGTMFKSPNLPLRYWIRSSTGTGSYSPICSQCASEGSKDELGYSYGYYNSSAITCNTIGTIYAIRGFKKQATYRDNIISFQDISIMNNGTTDAGIGLLLKNPTVSSAISYANTDFIQLGTPTNQTITSVGKVICSFPVSSNGGTYTLPKMNDMFLQNRIDDTMAEYVLAYLVLSTNQAIVSIANLLVL